ncbi:hypothetical protein FUA26_01175 [Seonamhaeicola algicola]|uniref:STAS/SEC14 domain-containing protein n=1 Tax=Seonamhaeicola algicola TaxID=1719036 RepID=A0A5C7B1S6_9FLAO|nr:hypothetical protein [Seonamhaeicola algicola]TXE15150.1 hypothetical protein FUA26_01175 [Seonamhaeicola algicola]
MLVKKSFLEKKIIAEKTIPIGSLYFFENFLVAEFNEGVVVNFESFNDATTLVKEFYGNKPFGFISNRVNSYAIDLYDAPLFMKEFTNLEAYATVIYNAINNKLFELEKRFFKFNKENFTDLNLAVNWVETCIDNN